MSTITDKLLLELKEATDLKSFLSLHEKDFISITPDMFLNELINKKNMSVAQVVKESGSGEYVYKIFKGDRNPSRDILISISLGMKLSLDETQLLLRISKFAVLDPRDKRDGVIIYALTHSLSVFETDDLLDENNLITLK
jgi:hypothetical protein